MLTLLRLISLLIPGLRGNNAGGNTALEVKIAGGVNFRWSSPGGHAMLGGTVP